MLPIQFNTPPLEVEHWEKVRAIAAKTIKNSLSDEMRKEFKKTLPDIEPENCFGMIGVVYGESNKSIMTPFLHKAEKLPEEIRNFLWMCYLGSHEYYCKDIGLIK